MKRSVVSVLIAAAFLSACATVAPADKATATPAEAAVTAETTAAADAAATAESAADESQGGGERVGN